jgi:hypothetical protein
MSASALEPKLGDDCLRPGNIVLAVYAPFGTDPVLSGFPDGTTHDLMAHPLVANLQKVAATGVHVVALVDMFDDDTYLVQIPAYRPAELQAESRGKQQMDAGATLSEFLTLAHGLAPEANLVLSMEGHGAGFLPDLDKRLFTVPNFTANGSVQWRIGAGMGDESMISMPFKADGEPLLPEGSPVLPIGGPTCPTNHLAPSTWAIGAAFQQAQGRGMPKVAVVHLNNCFNMSVELLHTVSPYADFATGYCNYNFFTAGAAYPLVFEQLAAAGGTTREQLARWFAAANHAVLLAAGHEPTVAGTVDLARMHDIAEKVDDLSDALLAALRTAPESDRPRFVDMIRSAIEKAQQYDSRPDFLLETPDELTDLDSLAASLLDFDFAPYKVGPAAEALRKALYGIKQYGDTDSPWMDPNVVWDFASPDLAMNIFLPDPLLNGLWDWRSQYYLDVNPDPTKPRVQPNIIDFVKVTDWVDFLIEYHRETPFQGLLPPLIPDIPLAIRPCDPRRRRGGSCDDGREGRSTFVRR